MKKKRAVKRLSLIETWEALKTGVQAQILCGICYVLDELWYKDRISPTTRATVIRELNRAAKALGVPYDSTGPREFLFSLDQKGQRQRLKLIEKNINRLRLRRK